MTAAARVPALHLLREVARGRTAILAFALGVFAIALAARLDWLEGRSAGNQASTTSALAALPVGAQATIAQVLGRDDAAYQAQQAGAGFALHNSKHRLQARFTRGQVEILAGDARLGFRLRAIGYDGALRAVAPTAPVAQANRVEYHRASFTEWYANGPLGLEQGFTLATAPASGAAGPLTLALALTGTLAPTLTGRDELQFEGSALRYRDLFAADAAGRPLPAWLELRGRTLLLRVDDTGARYPLTIDPFIEQGQLTASDGAADDRLGQSIAIAGNAFVAGAPNADVGTNSDQGAVYVFVRPAGGWTSATETAKLTASDGAAGGRMGFFGIAIAGNTIVASPRGAVYVFEKPAGGWMSGTETAKLTASDGAGLQVVAISGDTIVAGSEGPGPVPRKAYVFIKPAGGWVNATETAQLRSSDGAANFFASRSVAIAGDTIVVSAFTDDVGGNVDQGSLYVFVKPAGGWASATETAKLTASDGASGDFLGGFSSSVAIAGETIVAGAEHHDVGANADQGEVYVFVKPAGGWVTGTETARLTASEGAAGDFLGSSVAIAGGTIVAGAVADDVDANVNQGSAYVFVKPPGGWVSATETARLTASDGDGSSPGFGYSVGMTGNTIVVGAPFKNVAGSPVRGSVYVFTQRGR